LGLQHVGQVELEGGLVAAHDEEVGVPLRMDSIKRADTVTVFIVEVEAQFSSDLVVNAGLLYLEARSVDENIEFVLFALKQRSLLGDLGDAFAPSVNQMDIGPVVGRKVLVVKAGAFAHEHEPRLE